MLGHFSEETLTLYSRMMSEVTDQNPDFSEGQIYDFTRCVRPNGTAYGTRGKCRKGTEEAKQSIEPKSPSGRGAAKSSQSGLRDLMKNDIKSLGINPSKIKAEEWRYFEEKIKKGHVSREDAVLELSRVAEKRNPPPRSGGSTTLPESKAREIASALAKKHGDSNYQVEKTEGGFKVTHAYYLDSQVNREVKKHLQKTPKSSP